MLSPVGEGAQTDGEFGRTKGGEAKSAAAAAEPASPAICRPRQTLFCSVCVCVAARRGTDAPRTCTDRPTAPSCSARWAALRMGRGGLLAFTLLHPRRGSCARLPAHISHRAPLPDAIAETNMAGAADAQEERDSGADTRRGHDVRSAHVRTGARNGTDQPDAGPSNGPLRSQRAPRSGGLSIMRTSMGSSDDGFAGTLIRVSSSSTPPVRVSVVDVLPAWAPLFLHTTRANSPLTLNLGPHPSILHPAPLKEGEYSIVWDTTLPRNSPLIMTRRYMKPIRQV